MNNAKITDTVLYALEGAVPHLAVMFVMICGFLAVGAAVGPQRRRSPSGRPVITVNVLTPMG
ncbi:putative ion transporter superfamily protein YfcC [Catenulispora sp. GP43]